jgi:hypothetical protein
VERPRLLLLEPDLAVRLALLPHLHAHWRVDTPETARDAMRHLRAHPPVLAAVGVCGRLDGLRRGAGMNAPREAVTLAVQLRTDLRPVEAVVLYGHAPGARAPDWPAGVAPPEAWVPDGRDPEVLHAALLRVATVQRRKGTRPGGGAV